MVTNWILNTYFRSPKDWPITLGPSLQKGSPFAVVYATAVWKHEPFGKKIKALLSHHWTPSEEQLRAAAGPILMENIFGAEEDYGNHLLQLATWFYSKDWPLELLTTGDREKASSIDVFTGLTRSRYKDMHYPLLPLWMAKRDAMITSLIFPMVLKVPVISIRYFVDINYAYTFNAIRKAAHPQSDDLIDTLYELAFVQQKIAVSFHEYIRLLVFGSQSPQKTLATAPAVHALREIDTAIANLKASIEKLIDLVSLTYDLPCIAFEQPYAVKVATLQKALPMDVQKSFQWQLIADFIRPANLAVLDNYKEGLIYKNGMEVFKPLHEQHAQNTAAVLCALSLMAERLVALEPTTEAEQVDLLNLYNSLQ